MSRSLVGAKMQDCLVLYRALFLGRLLRRVGYVCCLLALSMLRVSVRGLPCLIYSGTDLVISVVCCGKDASLGQFGSCTTLGENIVTFGLRIAWRSEPS